MALKWGIVTAGGIAHAFVAGIQAAKSGELVATGARDTDRAKKFAEQWGGVGYGSYQEVLEDPEVEAVYIATPHHLHAEWTIKAAKAGKAVLCEKPFTLNSQEALAALSEIRRAGVFFMEAFMYRCSPQTRKLVDLLNDGAIGTVRAIDAEFSYGSSPDRVNFRTDPAVGGGGIMDVGTYCASFSQLVDKASGGTGEPRRVEYMANLDRGYDSYGVGCMEFESGVVAKIASGVHLEMRNTATIYGEEGSIHILDAWKSPPGTSMALNRVGHVSETFNLGCTTAELYAHEADAVAEFLAQLECPYMSIDDTTTNMRTLDRMRESCGLKFEAEL